VGYTTAWGCHIFDFFSRKCLHAPVVELQGCRIIKQRVARMQDHQARVGWRAGGHALASRGGTGKQRSSFSFIKEGWHPQAASTTEDLKNSRVGLGKSTRAAQAACPGGRCLGNKSPTRPGAARRRARRVRATKARARRAGTQNQPRQASGCTQSPQSGQTEQLPRETHSHGMPPAARHERQEMQRHR